MRLTADNSDEDICAFLQQPRMRHLRFWDAKTGTVFNASPCENCGTMSAHGGDIKIDSVSDNLNRALSGYYSTGIAFIEPLFDDEGGEFCEACGYD